MVLCHAISEISLFIHRSHYSSFILSFQTFPSRVSGACTLILLGYPFLVVPLDPAQNSVIPHKFPRPLRHILKLPLPTIDIFLYWFSFIDVFLLFLLICFLLVASLFYLVIFFLFANGFFSLDTPFIISSIFTSNYGSSFASYMFFQPDLYELLRLEQNYRDVPYTCSLSLPRRRFFLLVFLLYLVDSLI